MTIIQQLVSDEIARRKDLVADADARVLDAQANLSEAKANAKRYHDELDELKAWLASYKAPAV